MKQLSPSDAFEQLVKAPLEHTDQESFKRIKELLADDGHAQANPISYIIRQLSGKGFREPAAQSHWAKILSNKKDMEAKLGRHVAVQTAVVDYFSTLESEKSARAKTSRKGEAGKLKITFSSGTFENNDFVAIGTSNGTTSDSNLLDMDVNSVGCIARSGDDGTMLRSVTYVIQDEAGQYVDGKVCSFVAYGYSPNESSGTVPTMIDESSAPTF